MAEEPEVLITSLLQKIETSFQSRNGRVTKLAAYLHGFDRQQARHHRLKNIKSGGR